MRWIGSVLVLATGVASAQPVAPRVAPPEPPANRKFASTSWLPLHVELFARAVRADKEGDYNEAMRHYLDINRGNAPLPEVLWNLADLQRRMERTDDAVETLEKYLEVAATDADKKAAEAQIAKLKATPFRLSISGEEPGGALFIDGVRFASDAPVVIELPPGEHLIDWIGKEGFEHRTFRGSPMRIDVARLGASSSRSKKAGSKGGNVVISSTGLPSRGSWDSGGVTFDMPARFALPPGRYETQIEQTCSKLVFDAPRDGVVYVFVRAAAEGRRRDCTPITVTTQKVKP